MALGITDSLGTWDTSNSTVERITDNIPYTSAHPDDALVLVGPPRYSQLGSDGKGTETLYPVGMLQQFSYSQQRGLNPMQSIGSGRAFFASGKSTVSWNASRLFVKGPNLLKALYKNAEKRGVTISKDSFGERPSSDGAPNFVMNLDSELFLIPFGLMLQYRDKMNNPMGAVYLELCMISSFQSGLSAGQSMIMESVNGMADRLFTCEADSATSGSPTGSPVGDSLSSEQITDKIFGVPHDGLLQANNV